MSSQSLLVDVRLAADNLFSPNFGQPTVFLDPRRAMLSVRLNLGQ